MRRRIAALMLGVLLLAGCSLEPKESTELQRYEQECHNRGGFISKKSVNAWNVDYECINATPPLGGIST